MGSVYTNVNPRYTPGSPAMVDSRTADRVEKAEREFYQTALSGIWGAEEQARAERLGLGPVPDDRGLPRAIVEYVREGPDSFSVRCVLTEVSFERPFAGETLEEMAERRRHNAEYKMAAATLRSSGVVEFAALDVIIDTVYRRENPDGPFTPTAIVAWLVRCGHRSVLRERSPGR